jgi:superfamily I DNA/RNA helicase
MNTRSSIEKLFSWDPYIKGFTDPYQSMFEMFAKAPEISAHAFSEGKAPWEDIFNNWKQLLTAPLPNAAIASKGIEDFIELSKAWQHSCVNLQKAWISCLEKTATVYPSGEDKEEQAKNALNVYMKSCGEFMSACLQIADEQTRALSQFFKSAQTEEKSAGKKEPQKVKKEKPK